MTQPGPAPSAASTADASQRVAQRRALAIGISGGITSGFADIPDGGSIVRLGGGLLSLSEDEYKLWQAGQLAPTTEQLLEEARLAGIADPGQTLAELKAESLVITCTDDRESIQRIANALTVTFTGRLLGNGPHQSPHFLVGDGATPPLTVDVVVYQFLLWADGRTSIAEQSAGIDAQRLDPDFDTTVHVASWIPTLLRAGLIRLDLATHRTGRPDG
jgi:hypothetical protein